jgi:4-amino-4-deoxy-L-arabinose transferase-like glycosyltransferase
MRDRFWLTALLLAVFVVVLCLLGLSRENLIRNEGLRAQLAAEALATGNWLVPTLHGEPYLAKPPGMTVAIVLASLPVGRVTPLTARLPSVVAGLIVVMLFYRTFSRYLDRRAGLIAAAILPCSGLWLERLPSAEIDLVQLAWVTGSLVCLLRAVEASDFLPSGPKRGGRSIWLWWLAALACVAGGLFTKWTAPAFFYLAAVPFLARQRRLALLVRLPHLTAAGLVAILALGWLALAGRRAGWQTLIDTIGREALLRLSPAHHPRPYPWKELLTFPLEFLAADLPWSLAPFLALAPSFTRLWDERTRRLLLLCQSWLWANLIFWTFAPGHRARHMLPSQPAIAALAALVWIAWLAGKWRPIPLLAPGRALVALLAAWLAVKVVFVERIMPERDVHRQPKRAGETLARVVPPGEMLHLFRLKDAGLMFYYARPAQRVAALGSLPAGSLCLLTEAEWQLRQDRVEVLASLSDGRGWPLVLVRLVGPPSRDG